MVIIFTTRIPLFKNGDIHVVTGARSVKGLESKLLDLALSTGKNKTFNLKDITSLKLFQDIMLLIFISSF
jgi:hypothetical protein